MLPKRDWMEMTWQDIAGGRNGALDRCAAARRGRAARAASAARRRYLHCRSLSGARPRSACRTDLPVTFLPVQRIGVSAEHLAFPGTLTLSAATAIAAWTELGDSLARAGLRKLVLVTSHGGNVAAMELVARDLRTRLRMLAVTVGWHRFGYPEARFRREEKKHGIHGGDIETSLMLAAKSDAVRMDQAPKATPETVAMAGEFKWLGAYRPAGFAWMTQDLHPSGAVGDATLATAAKGDAALAARRASLRRTFARDRPFRSCAPARRAARLTFSSPASRGWTSDRVLAARRVRGLPKPRLRTPRSRILPQRKREVQRREAPKSWPRHAGECCHSLALRARRAPQDNPLARTACFGRAAPPGAPPRFRRQGGRPPRLENRTRSSRRLKSAGGVLSSEI